MQIRRFRAKDIQTALKMIKDELGSEAVILSTREIKDRGELGALVEVTAGAGYQAPIKQPDPPEKKKKEKKKSLPDVELKSNMDDDWGSQLKCLEGGLSEIKDLLLDLTHRSSLSEKIRNRTDLVRLYRELMDAELDASLARALVEKTAAEANGRPKDLKRILALKLSTLIKNTGTAGWDELKQAHFIAFTGPSGVGKTTTMAKMAAWLTAKEKKKVAMINLDSYRLGAAEQLKTYARIMGLPLRIAQDADEFEQAAELFDNMDAVLIDTSSRCLTQPDAMEELEDQLYMIDDLQAVLVLSAATKDRDIADAIRKSSSLPVSSLIFTKIDETKRYGNVINNLIKFKKPVSFLTNGQKVPDDIILATPSRLADLITSGAIAS